MGKFDLDQEVSRQLSFIFLLVLSFAVAWYTIKKGEEILDIAKGSPAFNPGKAVQEVRTVKD
jgi:hypothetical protein